MTYPKNLGYWRDFATLHSTRFPDAHYAKFGPKAWRILVKDTCGDWDVTGPPYATRAELLVDLPRLMEAS